MFFCQINPKGQSDPFFAILASSASTESTAGNVNPCRVCENPIK
jgi:hypothetical protein